MRKEGEAEKDRDKKKKREKEATGSDQTGAISIMATMSLIPVSMPN